MNRLHSKKTKSAKPRSKSIPIKPHKSTTRPIMTKARKPTTRQLSVQSPPLAPPQFTAQFIKPTRLSQSTLPTTTFSTRNMWFLPKKETFKSKLQKSLLNIFNLVPPPPSVNLEEFALMSKMFQVIIDTRTEELRNEGKIPKSVHVPLSTMTEENRENIGIQFAKLTVLVYDQNGTTVDEAASYLRDCGAEAWSLEGGADAFKAFVEQTRDGTYTRRVTLEEAQQHVYAQAMAGGRIPRKYDPNRVIEQFDLDSSDDEGYFAKGGAAQSQNGTNGAHNGQGSTAQHTVSINPIEYNRQQQILSDGERTEAKTTTTATTATETSTAANTNPPPVKAQNPFAKAKSPQIQETQQQQVNV